VKITDIVIQVLELPGRSTRIWRLEQVPTVNRIQYRHGSVSVERPAQQMLLRVQTDEGLEGLCTLDAPISDPALTADLLRVNAVGEDPFKREHLFQKLHLGTRWVYQRPGWFGTFDNCLWDIVGKAAGLPLYQLIGQVRDGVPIYQTAGDGPLELYIEHIERGRELGIRAYKPHSYKGGLADIPLMQQLRAYVGPDYDLILDPVCSYTYEEAVAVGRALEELRFVWLEEPFHEHKMHLYQRLCDELTIDVMATETLMNDMNISAQWLIHGATDRLRANARNGTTQVLKLAHLAELHATSIELNGVGGLFGQVHAHLGCSIANNSYFEHSVGGGMAELARELGMQNPPPIVDGCLIPASGPGWGAEWDMQRVEQLTVGRI